MKRILSLFVVLLFVVSCGGSSEDSVISPDSMDLEDFPEFEPIEIPTFTGADLISDDLEDESELRDADAVPEEAVELVGEALTQPASRAELITEVREASFCNALDDVSDKEIWDVMVDDFNLEELDSWGSNLDEAVRNLLAYDLDLELDEPEEIEFYGDTLEIDEFWSILADEVDGKDTLPGQCT